MHSAVLFVHILILCNLPRSPLGVVRVLMALEMRSKGLSQVIQRVKKLIVQIHFPLTSGAH